MSPLWPPVCKRNSQQSTGQEVILVYSLGTLLCREHSGIFSSPSSLNGTLQPLFFFSSNWNPTQFVLTFLGNEIVRQSTKDVNTHYLLSFIPYEQTKANKEQQRWAQRLTVVWCLWCRTWPIKLWSQHYFPPVELKDVSRGKQQRWVVVWHHLVSLDPPVTLISIHPIKCSAAFMSHMDLHRIIGRRV